MKTRKILLVLMLLLLSVVFATRSYAICFDMYIEGEESIQAGDTIQLEAYFCVTNDLGEFFKVQEDNVTNEAVWTSDNEDVAMVENGEVFGVSEGYATIIAEYTDGDIIRTAEFIVHVYGIMIDNDQDVVLDDTTTVVINPDDTVEIDPIEVDEYDPNDSRFSPICYADETEVVEDYNDEVSCEEEIIEEESPVIDFSFLEFFRSFFNYRFFN